MKKRCLQKKHNTKRNSKIEKKGISPVIATVLLIAMVVVLGLVIFMWFRGFTQEAVTKFDTNVELVCSDVVFDASYNAGVLSIINTGNVPIYRMKFKTSGQGSYETTELTTTQGWSENGLNQGGTFSNSVPIPSGTDQITLIPVLMGSSKNGQQSYTCNEEQYGTSLVV